MENDFDIAIVGLACRFPGAKNADEFWKNLAGGVESITRLTDEEILHSGVPQSHLPAPNYVKAAPVLDEPGAFDAAFFGYTPGEARTMDPQQRILLELAHESLENAGIVPARTAARVGVFAGSAMNTYFMHAGLDGKFSEDYIPTLIANDKDFLSTRISYKLDLKGPSLTVQTACSTSLVAVHLARQSLLSEECDVALAGAISVRVPHRAGYFSDPGGVTSPDGHVRAFDAEANGTVFGSGGGVIVMKRLRDALADGDTIRAIIKGSAINNDGAEKAGYTAPSVNSQADAIIEALANADVDAESISYIETHGSGTPVGDPIEVRALTKAFRASTQRAGFCAIGSVKTNIGHLDAAAGMAGLIKTVLALQHRQIPASLNYARPNPEIDFAASPFFVNTRLAEWKSEGPRRAGIMATGMGGTNAHVVLEEAPQSAPEAGADEPALLVLSARTEAALAAGAETFRAHLEANASANLNDAAFTLQTGRRAMRHRRFIVARHHAAALASLPAKPARHTVAETDGATRPLVLLLPGVGDHYVGMGRELYSAFAVFRAEVDRCAEILRAHLGHDIREILWPKDRDWNKSSAGQGIDLKKMLAGNTQPADDADTLRLNEITNLQPALFTIEYALAMLWIDLIGEPHAIVGHSMGEYVAACLSGVFSLEDALRLIVKRTQLVASLPPAKMLAVTLPEAELLPLLTGELSLALINGPSLCIVAGPPVAIEEFARTLTARGVMHRPVQNTHAFHSRMLDPIVPAFVAEVRSVRLSAPRIPFTSNVTGRWITAAEACDPEYWAEHANHTARFDDALRTLWQMENPVLLETGPGRTLGVLAQQHPARPQTISPTAISTLRHHYETQPDEEVLLTAAGRLWLAGAMIAWEKLHAGKSHRKIPLPTYPFEREVFWLPKAGTPDSGETHTPIAPSGVLEMDRWFHVPSWERTAPLAGNAKDTGPLWLIVSDIHGNDHGFCELLAKSGAATRTIRLGDSIEHHAEECLRIFREIKGADWPAIHIIHLGCVAGTAASGDPDSRQIAQDGGFFSLMQIAQAIGDTDVNTPVKIAVISSGIHEVIGGEELNPAMATVLGPCGVIPKEFPNVACISIDLAHARTPDSIGDLHRDWILSEFAKADTDEMLAYRGAHRWRRKFIPVALPAVPRVNRLCERGVYLITGGTGGIGLAVARYLAETCRARLVLTKRNPFPEKSQWKDLLARTDTAPDLAKTLRELIEIESLGSEVEIMVADSADSEAMRAVLNETLRKFHSINGVIHAAGVVRAGLIQASTKKLAEAILTPKICGTVVLHELLKDTELDFFVLFSSMASVTGPFAHAEYSAANCFLDAFAIWSRSCTKHHAITINWPVWKEVGVVAKLEAFMGVEDWKEAALKNAILTKDGLEAFQRILGSDLPQVIVSPEELGRVLAQKPETTGRSLNFTNGRNLEMAATPGRAGSTSNEPPGDDVETTVSAVWSGVLGIERISLHEQFAHLGGHSLLALQILAKLRTTYRVEISLRDFFEAPTIAQLSAVIRDKILQDIENMTDEEVRKLIADETPTHE